MKPTLSKYCGFQTFELLRNTSPRTLNPKPHASKLHDQLDLKKLGSMLWLPCEMSAKFWPISIGISLCSSASLIQTEEMSVMMMSVLRSQLDIPNNVPVICIGYLPAGSSCDLGLERPLLQFSLYGPTLSQ